VTNTSATIDPYLLALQANYYYPLTRLSVMTPDEMQVEHGSNGTLSQSTPPTSTTIPYKQTPTKKTVMIEDSVETIAELISEIQALDPLDISPSVSSDDHPPSSPHLKPTPICFSMARQKHQGYGATAFLHPLKKFFHVLLSTRAISILPVRNDSKASPIRLTLQVNELTQIGARVFFKASKASGGLIAGDFHVLSSLPYNELSSNEIISNWMALQGYYMVKCDCQSSDMVKIGFMTRVRPFVWREDLRNKIKDMALWQSSPFQFVVPRIPVM